MAMRIKEVAELAGISVRTLHYYDEIGLLVPEEKTDAGYRLYSDQNIETLQQILFYRELGFSLQRIKEIIHSPSFDRQAALKEQREMLYEKRRQLDEMIETIEKTIKHEKGELNMSNEEKFAGFDFSNNPYEQEARDRWGDDVVERANAKVNNLSDQEKKSMEEQMNSLFRQLTKVRNHAPDSDEAQTAIHKWYEFLNSNFNHHYSLEAFRQLGQMYVEDERFTNNIDQFGEGLAVFLRDAMQVYAEKQEKQEL